MDKDVGWVDPGYFGEICVVKQFPHENVLGRYLVVAGSEVDENGFGQFIHEDWLEKVEVFKVKVGQKYKTVGDWGACHGVVTITSVVDDVVFLNRKSNVGSGSEGHANVDTFFPNDKAYELHAGKDSPLCYVLIKDVDPVSNRLDDLEEKAKKLGPSMESDVDRLVRASAWLGLDWSRVDIERVVGLAGDLK